jgi:hypothetical protein
VREPGGRVLVATVEGDRVTLREGRHVRPLGPAKGRGQVVAAVAPNGRAVVAWGTYDEGIEVNSALRTREGRAQVVWGTRRPPAAQLTAVRSG